MSVMISPGVRTGAGAALLFAAGGAAGRGAASTGRGRGAGGMLSVATGLTGSGAFLNIGAGCEPDCMNKTLIRIASVASVAAMNATASRELHRSARNMASPPSMAADLVRPADAARLGTFLHRDVGRRIAGARHQPLDHGSFAAARALTAQRQMEGD